MSERERERESERERERERERESERERERENRSHDLSATGSVATDLCSAQLTDIMRIFVQSDLRPRLRNIRSA